SYPRHSTTCVCRVKPIGGTPSSSHYDPGRGSPEAASLIGNLALQHLRLGLPIRAPQNENCSRTPEGRGQCPLFQMFQNAMWPHAAGIAILRPNTVMKKRTPGTRLKQIVKKEFAPARVLVPLDFSELSCNALS